MFTRRDLLLVPLLFVPAFAAAQPAPSVADPAKLKAITPAMEKFVAEGDLAGVVTVVGRKGGIVHHEAVGYRDLDAKEPMRTDALFRIASMTKPITAIGVMILVDEGKVN